MKAKVIGLPKAEDTLIGMTVPSMEYYNQNNVASIVEQSIANEGYEFDSNGTLDLPAYETEVKSRSKQATSPQTIGSMSIANIVNTPYSASSIKTKSLRQFRVKHDQTYNVITDAKVYDFSDPFIQEKLEDAYEYCRNVISQTKLDEMPDYISSNGRIGYFERTNKKRKTVYAFRVSNGNMKKIESTALSSKTFHKLFE